MAPEGPVYVTRPSLPPLDEFIPYLRKIWDSRILTNGGPFHEQFERALGEYLGVKHVSLFTNGTIALVTALQALRIGGEVITTPYSFVATSHSLLWNRLTPVFVDVDPETFNLDPRKIEAAITPRTTAILPVHVYGNPCDVDAIRSIASARGLKVLYDAAHAFGVRDAGGSLARHGDLSVLSFHATKVFNTFEGGAIVCPDADVKVRVDQLKNFGHAGETTVLECGINGKMSEFAAALGLLQLRHVDAAIAKRKAVDEAYRARLAGLPGVRCVAKRGVTADTYGYFPVLLERGRDEAYRKLKERGIHPRRYFHPLISDFPMYRGLPGADRANLPVAASVADRILCLPIHPDLDPSVVETVAGVLAG